MLREHLTLHQTSFRRVEKRGPRPRGRIKYQKKFHCFHCKINIATSIGAMISHAKSHKDDDFIKIGAISSGSYKNVWRPEQHTYNSTTGKLFFGSDARLHEIRIPSTTPFNSESIFCRKCHSHPIIYSDNLSLAEKARSIEKMRTHEKKCKAKPKL